MSSHKSTTKSSSSGSSMSLILGFSKSMEKGSFGVLYAMIKGNTFPRILTIISLLIEFCQLSSFGFKQQYPWGGDLSKKNYVTSFFNIWYVAYQFYRGKIANIWIIRTLRWFVSTTVAVLFIPIISLLLIGLDCDYSQGGILKTFSNDNIYCFKGANLSIAIVSIILIIVFSIVGFTSSATYYEYDSNVKSRFSKPHARFDVYILFVKLILALLNSLVDFSPWTTSIVYFILSITLVFGSIIILPYNNQRLNQVKSGFYTTVFWVSFMTLVTMGINDETTATTCYIAIVGAFFAFPIGYFSNRFYYNWLSSKIDQLKLPTSSSANDFNEITKNEKRKSGDIKEKESSSPSKVTWGKQPITLGSKRQIIFPFFQNKFVMSFFVEIMVRKLLRGGNGSNGDDGISSNSNESIERANNLYQCGLQYFPNSDLLWMAYCNFLFTVRKDRHIGYAALEKLRRMKPSFDVRFFIYQRDKEREQIMDSDLRGPEHTGKIQDFVSYMEFKKLYYGAKRHHVKCLTYIKKFWGLLLHETVDLHRLSDLSGRIATTENKANESYERLLALNPNSVRVLRDYSQFLEEVVKDTESSYKIQKKAEAIEDIMSKSQTTDFKTIDIKNLENSDTELDQVLKQEPNAIQLAKIDADIERSGSGSKSGSSKSKDDSSESSSSSKGRRGKYKEFQQSNAINKLSWLMIGTTACCIIFLIVMLIVLRDLSVKHTHSYQGIISITDCASEAVSIAINLNTMQAISISAGSAAFPFEAAEAMITQYRKQNDRSLIIMKNIHDAIYWGEGDPTSYVGDNLSKLKSINGFDVFDIGSTIFSFEEFNRSSTLVDNKEMINIYSTPSVNMTILVSPPGTNSTNYITVTQTYNAWKAGNSFYESALIANKMSVQEIKDRAVFDSDFKFIILNAPSNIPEMYMKIQQVYIKSLIDDINTTLDTMLYVWVAIFCFLIILGAVLFRPIVTKISREKIRTLVLFSLAPKEVVFKLSSKKIKMTSLDSGSERDNLFDTTDEDDADDIDNHEHLQVDERKKNDDIDGGSIVNRSINFGSHRRPLMNSTNVLASTTTINRGTISNRLNEDHDKVQLIENSISNNNNNKGYGWDGKSKRNLNKKSLRSVLRRLHWSYVLAIFLLFGFITMGLWVTYSVVHDNTQSGYVLGKSCSRSLDSRIINYYIAELYTFDNDANANEALEAVLQLQSNHQSLPYLEDVRPLMEGSYGCWMLNKSNCITSDSIYYNDVSIGLDWLVDQYAKHSVSLVNTDPSLLSTSPELGWMQAIGSDVVFQGLDTATFTYFQYYLSQKDWATKVLTSVLAISCVLLLIIHLLLFRPFMNHLRIQHIHTLALLRLAPDDIRFMEVSDKVIDED
ncbi:hypothetical protein ACTFIW_008032 [Dictyostelium discoideum]